MVNIILTCLLARIFNRIKKIITTLYISNITALSHFKRMRYRSVEKFIIYYKLNVTVLRVYEDIHEVRCQHNLLSLLNL